MPTQTSRLALPFPVITDPANVPGDMGRLAGALDSGANANYSGVAVMVATPSVVGSLPTSPIIGTFYCVNSSPPYMLYYSGDGPGTSLAPAGWRLVGGVGTNTANIAGAGPGLSVSAGNQPVWAALDHVHATPPWGTTGQVSPSNPGDAANGGALSAYARIDHTHARELVQVPIGGVIIWPYALASKPSNFLVMNGSSFSSVTYSTLYALNGNSTVLPNWTDRFPVGAGGSIAPTVGAMGGSTSITQANMPPHTHGVTDPTHAHLSAHPASGFVVFFSPSSEALQGGGTGQQATVTNATEFASTGITINSAGSGTPYTQPNVGVNFIVRAL